MKKILTLLLLVILSSSLFGQISNTKVVRIANASTVFLQPLSEGNILIDLNTDKSYLILTAVAGTASLSTLTVNVDYKEYSIDATNHSSLANLTYATAGHTGFEPTIVKGNLTEATSSVLTITGGTASVIGSGTTVQIKQANTSQSGYLSSTNWNTFNNKLSAEVDGSLNNEGSLTVEAGTATTSLISSSTSGSTPVTLQAGTNITLSESGNTVTINSSATGGSPAVGVLYISGAGVINHVAASTYYDINIFTIGAANNMTATNSTLTIPATAIYDIRYHISCTHAVGNTVVHTSVFVNGLENGEIEAERKIGSGGDYGNYSGGGIVSLNAGDVVKLKTNASNIGNQTISSANFSIKRIN